MARSVVEEGIYTDLARSLVRREFNMGSKGEHIATALRQAIIKNYAEVFESVCNRESEFKDALPPKQFARWFY
jgi:hypothetical protein